MKNILSILTAVLLLFTSAIVQGADAVKNLAGVWLGTLDVGPAKLRVVFNLTAAPDGKLSATMDSPDQGARGIAVDSVTFTDGSLVMRVNVVNGGFTGTMDVAGNTVAGQWTQGPNSLPLSLSRGSAVDSSPSPEVLSPADLAASKEAARKLSGIWNGTLAAGDKNLRLRVAIAKTDTGAATGTMDSLDQGALGIPISAVTLKGGNVRFVVRGIGGTYTGTLTEDGTGLNGQWQQGGNSLPLDLKKANPE